MRRLLDYKFNITNWLRLNDRWKAWNMNLSEITTLCSQFKMCMIIVLVNTLINYRRRFFETCSETPLETFLSVLPLCLLPPVHVNSQIGLVVNFKSQWTIRGCFDEHLILFNETSRTTRNLLYSTVMVLLSFLPEISSL